MKKAVIYAVLVLGCWSISSCRKETSIEDGATRAGNFTAIINGVQWAAAPSQEQATITQGLINVTGVSADNQEISISIPDTAAGVYALNWESPSLAAYADLDSSNLYGFSTSQSNDTTKAGGTVTITAVDAVHKTVTGSFSFNVYRSLDGQEKTISSGVFNQIPYTTALPASNPTDTITATIDGNAWIGQNVQASSLDGTLTLVGASLSGNQSVALIFPNYVSAGTYPLTSTTAIPSYLAVYDLVSNGNNNADPGITGSITVLTNNTSTMRISGTFQFSTADLDPADPDHAITKGYFSVYYGQ